MNLIYNSEQYSVVEFGIDSDQEALRSGGYEITDKSGKREIFIRGAMAKYCAECQEPDCLGTQRGRHRRFSRQV